MCKIIEKFVLYFKYCYFSGEFLNINMENWKCVYNANQLYKVEVIRDFLTSANIEAVVVNKMDSSYIMFGDVELYVQPDDESRAVELIKNCKFD